MVPRAPHEVAQAAAASAAAVPGIADVGLYVREICMAARAAAAPLARAPTALKDACLQALAASLRAHGAQIARANEADLTRARAAGLDAAALDRLTLSPASIEAMAVGVEQIAQLPDPVGAIEQVRPRPSGIEVGRMRVPLGVIGIIYESRPNVTVDAAALCLKSGNAVILRGGKEAFHSNRAIASVVAAGLQEAGIDPAAVQLVESTDRALVPLLLKLDNYIDLVIPRGGESLIRAVARDSTIPVLKHFTGNCHIYVDAATTGIEKQVREVCVNAKTSYPGGAVCNAVEKILFHQDAAPRLLAAVCEDLAATGVEIRGDEKTRQLYPKAAPASESDWPLEYLSLTIAIKVVADIEAAIHHINEYGSHHTDAILSESAAAIDRFVTGVDSASIMVNASTRWADGGEYGLGAEIGISTDKLHARGPMGANDLTTYKWVVTGNGHCRPGK
jgi:glutamate-5-semialdehyde dehydrogenase